MKDDDRIDLIRSLLDMEECETLDFKEFYPMEKPSERKEFAKDICALANTSGGHIVIGVRDETWERVGINPAKFDKESMYQAGMSLLDPHVPITVEVVQHENLYYGLITVTKTHMVHNHHQSKKVYLRVNSSNFEADPETITRLYLESTQWFQSQWQGLTNTSAMTNLNSQLPKSINEVFNLYLRKLLPDKILNRFSEGRREQHWITKHLYQEFFRVFKEATNIEVDENSPITDDIGTKLLLLRGYGMLAASYLKRRDYTDERKIRLVLELDPEKLTTKTLEGTSYEKDAFFRWAKLFSGYTEQPYDRELIELDLERPWNEILEFMRIRFTWATKGMMRLNDLTKLYTEYYKKRYEVLQNLEPLWWAILADLSISAIPDIGKGKFID